MLILYSRHSRRPAASTVFSVQLGRAVRFCPPRFGEGFERRAEFSLRTDKTRVTTTRGTLVSLREELRLWSQDVGCRVHSHGISRHGRDMGGARCCTTPGVPSIYRARATLGQGMRFHVCIICIEDVNAQSQVLAGQSRSLRFRLALYSGAPRWSSDSLVGSRDRARQDGHKADSRAASTRLSRIPPLGFCETTTSELGLCGTCDRCHFRDYNVATNS